MRRFPSFLDFEPLIALSRSVPTVVDGTGILMANGQWRGLPSWGGALLTEAAADLQRCLCTQEGIPWQEWKLAHVMVNVIPPGIDSGWHTDPEPGVPEGRGHEGHHYRWHLPLVTNEWAGFEAEAEVHMDAHHWHGPVRYWERHRAFNYGAQPRTHLILDLL